MKKANKRLVILFSIIFVLCIVAGYTVYKAYNINQNNPINGEEDINLGYKTCSAPGCSPGSLNNKTCQCSACESGYKLVGDTCEKKKTSCNAGYYLNDGDCPECPKGKVCLGGISQPVSCTDFDRVEDCPSACHWWESVKECHSEAPPAGGGMPCSYVSPTFPGALSPESAVYITFSVDTKSLPQGYDGYCLVAWSYSGDSGSDSGSVSIHVYNASSPGTVNLKPTLKECDNITISTTMDGKTSSKEITVRTNFSDELKNKNLSDVSNPPGNPKEADEQGASYYVEECDSSKQNCTVHVRGMCDPKPACYYNQNTWNYCWGASCGDSYVKEANTKESDCKNVCYCNNEGKCGIWAKKDYSSDPSWAGYKIIKDKSNNYIYDSDKCVAYNYCCVNNGTLELSTEAKPYESVPEKSCPTNWTLLEDVKKEDCKTETVEKGSCNINDIPSPKQTGAADSCESTVSIKVDEGKQCTNTTETTTTSFYEISCAKTVKTGFDYGNDGKTDTIRTLYKGEGFGFGINVETSVNCKYTFYDTVWKAAYDKAMNKIKKIDSNLVQYVEKNQTEEWKTYINNNILNKNGVTDASILYDLWDVIEGLVNSVKAYNEYEPSKNYKENGEITLTVNEKGKSVITKHKLISDVKEEGTYKSSEISTNKLSVPLVSDPKSYILSSNTPRKVLLIPKKVCIDKKGNFNTIEGTECPKNTIDGGNKIYTDMATDVTDENVSYPINITIGGLGSNDSSVTNDKCNLKIIESKYIYRPIDVSNPFISNSWQKGKNWVNETFDFTKVINKDTWQDNSKRKVITLTAKDIAAIKESNAKAWRDGNSPYLGLCISQEETLQYEITKKLCSIIK